VSIPWSRCASNKEARVMRSFLIALVSASILLRAPGVLSRSADVVPRFARDPNPIALTGPARPTRYLEASGLRAAFLGREDGTFEAWAYPLKILHGFELAFRTPAYAEPIRGADLVSWIDARPEAATVRYAHDAFTADAIWLVPRDEPGGLILLDIHTSVPLEVVVRFRIDLKPMWPAALGGQYSYWDRQLNAYVAGEASRRHAAIVGSPLALTPPEQPAHNLPDAPSQFTIAVSPADAARGLIPITIAATPEGLDRGREIYARLPASAERSYHEAAAHYRRLREELTSIETPDDRIDRAFEWGKVALDKGFVCNPQLGCGLIAGLGPSGTTERPGFGWFFGGDAFINSWAVNSYGDFETVKRSLDFLRERQRADGKMPHELSQGAAYIRWFEDFPYGYYHADTTPLYITAVRDYVRSSGDTAFARTAWPSVRKAYDYCASTDEDGDGLMDNTKAGLAAVETGTLRQADVLTDVFLAAAWTEAAAAAAELADLAGDSFAATARRAADKARASLNARFLDDEGHRINFAVMKGGRGQAEATVWPAFGIWRGAFDAKRPAVQGALDDLARPGLAADWGARMLSKDSRLYEPLSYNNGAVWPFLSGFAALALYANHRSDAAWQYVEAMADLTFLESRGYIAELFSGDRLRSIDAAVPHQLFATSGFVSSVMRGLVGLREPVATDPHGALTIEPQLPAWWPYFRIRRLRWHDATWDVAFTRSASTLDVAVSSQAAARPIVIKVLDTESDGELRFSGATATETRHVPLRPRVAMTIVQESLTIGDPSRRLRVISTTTERDRFVAHLEGLREHRYRVRLTPPESIASVIGGDIVRRDGMWTEVAVDFPAGAGAWAAADLVVRLASRENEQAPAMTSKPSISRASFGHTPDGTAVEQFTLTNGRGVEIKTIQYGAVIVSIRVPDRNGRVDDVVLGFDTLDGYLTKSRYFGAVVGRYANRIAKGRFVLDGKTYQLATNNGPNHLHGGLQGFDKVVWRAEPFEREGSVGVVYTHASADGDQGYPGALSARVIYTLTPANELVVEYDAKTDKPTIVNLTQHSYFNLAGDGSGDILGHQLTIDADRFTPIDETLIPTGELAPVEGTPFDFRRPMPIGARIDVDDVQLRNARGYDHDFVINRPPEDRGSLVHAARLVDPKSGRTLDVATTEPGMQFYSGNFLDGSAVGKAGRVYNHRFGLCLETQHFPDSPNHPNFPSTVLRPGQPFRSKTTFTFGVAP
jgi:galactose mutarotase